MVIGFSVRNFRSFLGRQYCSFLASRDNAHESTQCIATGLKALPRLTKTAVIFGPNASGKSNLLVALRTMRDLVVHSTAYSDADLLQRYMPFRLDDSEGCPTMFDIDLLLEGTRYRYSFSFDAQRITSEQLLVYTKRKSQRWFGRRFDEAAQTESWTPFSASFTGPREMWRKATRPKALFLTTAAKLNAEQLQPLLHWFEHKLEIVLSSDTTDLKNLATQISAPKFKARVLDILRAVDIPINDIRITEPAVGTTASYGVFVRRSGQPVVEFLHARSDGKASVWLDSNHESAGTHRLVSLLAPMLDAIENGKLIAIDEFDSCLHPLVARFLVQLIGHPVLSRETAQLLLSSHNISLMDLDILRRDQIWLMELDEGHASNLSALAERSPRKHELIAKSYLRGRYGAVPEIDLEH